MKTIKMTALAAIITVGGLISGGCTVMSHGVYDTSGRSGAYRNYQNPHWAPPYHQGARYYYIPDIETYFDLSTGDFIFLYNGRWSYSRQLPSIYATFDLDNCFTIILNTSVFQPWRHHQYYISHYPRYYYRDYYDFSGFPCVRGYNENLRKALYWDDNQRHRSRDWNDRNIRDKRNFKYSYEDRRDQAIWREKVSSGSYQTLPDRNNPPRDNTRDRYDNQGSNRDLNQGSNRDRYQERNTDPNSDRNREVTLPGKRDVTKPENREVPRTGNREITRPGNSEVTHPENREQKTNYYGKPIGNSVKVTRGMQQPQEKQTRETRESQVNRKDKDNKNTGTNSTTRNATKRKTSTTSTEKDKEQKSTQKSGGSIYRR
ncbi:MAG: hypothetical protein PHP30_08520 [Bacteroidales bacterium]|nr:hypothetical protein [Bacteroidales bacterium]MDD2425836.1 hypothetical protein [Bacteroidales bacterium]MDD3990122.1 hypothetical protein [Bacteroidales bacterium]